MTEEERDILKEAKEGVSDRLSRIDISRYHLCSIDPRLDDYCRAVSLNPTEHCLWEQLSVEHWFRKMDSYRLDEAGVRRFFFFYEQLWLPGKSGLTRYALTPVQAFQFANVYGFLRSDGRRLVRECALYVPRKFSKTTGTAAFALYDLLRGDFNAEIYIGANSQQQAKKCFDVIRGSLRKLDNLGRRFVINEQQIKPTLKNPRQASAQCLTSNARTKDGLNASTVIMDEFSQARDSGLLDVLTTSMGVRENPLTVIITTASDVFDGPFFNMLTGYKEVLLGRIEDDSLFPHLFEPDIDDREDDAATWRKVHPHLGITIQSDYYEAEFRKAQRNGAQAMLTFRTKLLNTYTTDERKSWISPQKARAMARNISIDDITGHPDAMAAIDLSVRGDFSAVTVGFYLKSMGAFCYITDYFFPENALSGHVNERLYRVWASQGHLHLLPGDVIDYDMIVDHVLKISERVNLIRIGYDPYKAQTVVNMLGAAGGYENLTGVSQTIGSFNMAVEEFEYSAWRDRIIINANPINYYCFGNAVLMEDSNENKKPTKREATGRIDGVITMLMCHKLFIDEERLL